MKKHLFMAFATLICAVSCQKEMEDPGSELTGEPIYAEIEQSCNSKTYVDEFRNVCFQKGDQIVLFNGSTLGKKYEVDPSADGQTSGDFFEVKGSGGSIGAGTPTQLLVAYYPHSSVKLRSSSADKSTYELTGVNFPSSQQYDVDHIIAQNSLSMVSARTMDQGDILFKNTCGILKLNIKGYGHVKTISLKGNNHEKISGKATITIQPNVDPVMAMASDATEEIVLDCGGSGILLDPKVAKQFMIVIPPTKFSAGFELNITSTEGISKTMKTSKEKIVERSKILNMTEFQFGEAPIEDLTFSVKGVDFKMVKVNGGTFTMGATAEQEPSTNADTRPAHQVTLSDYYIAETELTQELWSAVMGTNPSNHKGEAQLPVEHVTWNMIVNQFLPKLNSLTGNTFVLPTEAQMEFAARGGNHSKHYLYSGSNTLDDVAWYQANSQNTTHPVKQKQPNELGLYDMSGNVWEWCADRFGNYTAEAQMDPTGTTRGSNRVLRGGDFSDLEDCNRVFHRNQYNETYTYQYGNYGFRLALSEVIAINKDRFQLIKGQSETLTASINGIIPLSADLVWTSSNPGVALIDGNGTVMALTPGITEISVKRGDHKAFCKLEVLDGFEAEVKGLKIPMIKVDGGTFTMGSIENPPYLTPESEKPAHQVTLSDYYIGQFELNQNIWKAVMGSEPSIQTGKPEYPVVVSWDNVINGFLPALNKITGMQFSLPTEAQWEFAALGGNKSQGYNFSGSNTISDVAWYTGNTGDDDATSKCGLKLPNELYLYDMSGNIDEWCSDWYGAYTAEAQTNPLGPSSGRDRVTRGGYYWDDARNCRSKSRGQSLPSYTAGFRLVISSSKSITSISLNKTSLTLTEGNTEILSASFSPANASNTKLNWTSSSPSVATVDQNGIVIAKSEGSTKITVTAEETGVAATCDVVVKKKAPMPNKSFTVNGVSFEMIAVEAGSFTMGATAEQGNDASSNELPTHKVSLPDYYIGKTEVTQELWKAVMGSNPSENKGNLKNPVETVSWFDIVNKFLPELNRLTGSTFVLPTEAQWEFAARGGNKSQGYKYSGSNNAADVAWTSDNSQFVSHPVGQKIPNELGICDMSGNVWEWCSDWYGSYRAGDAANPSGPLNGSTRVIRGGDFDISARYSRVSIRLEATPEGKNKIRGFRLAMTK